MSHFKEVINIRNNKGYVKDHADRADNDFYATPSEEVKNILRHEELHGAILDNSCGKGHLIKPVKEKYPNHEVIATDLIDRGYGEGGHDYLNEDYPYTNDIDTIIMNPPFGKIIPFVNKSLEIANKKVLLFAQLQFLESQSRYNNIFSQNKPDRIYIYVDRVACAKGGNWDNAGSSSMTYAWFVWDEVDDTHEFKWIRRADKLDNNLSLF